jgi:hypothetical protein
MGRRKIFVPKYLDKSGLYNFSKENFPDIKFGKNSSVETALKKLIEICKEEEIDLEIEPREEKEEEVVIKTKKNKFYTLNTQVMCGDRSVLKPGTRIKENHKEFKEFMERGFLEIVDLSDYID